MKREPKALKPRHYFEPYDETLLALDGLAQARHLRRGTMLARLIATAARENGIALTDAPMNRAGRPVIFDGTEKPFKWREIAFATGDTVVLPNHADIDGPHGVAFSALKAKWRLGPEDALDRIVTQYGKTQTKAA